MVGKIINRDETKAATENGIKVELYGEELVEKIVKKSGNNGRVYLPPHWCGSVVKIIRIN